MTSWTLKLLGGCELRSPAGEPVSLSTRKALAMLVYLAMQPGRRASRQRLATLLWEDGEPDQARLHLRKALWLVRSEAAKVAPSAPPPAASDGAAIYIPDGTLHTDVEAFARAAATGQGDTEALEAASRLYTGEFLRDFTVRNAPGFEDWATIERQRLREEAVSVLARNLDAIVASGGSPEAALRATIRLLDVDPLLEHAHRSLMRLHVRQGRPASALSHYHNLRETLQRELGVDPELATQALFREISATRRGAERPAPPAEPRAPDAAGATEAPSLPEAEAVVDTARQAAGPDAVRSARSRKAGLLTAGALAVLVAGGGWMWRGRSEAPAVQRIFPIATSLRLSGRPALSPDGSRVVFTARDPGSSNVDLYLATIGDPSPSRLTEDAAIDDNGVWSPDGTNIAFSRSSIDGITPCTIFVKTVPNGHERPVGRCRTSFSTRLAWADEGRSLIFTDQDDRDAPSRLHLLRIDTGAVRPLSSPPAEIFGDHQPVISFDGGKVAFIRTIAGRSSDIFTLDLGSGEERQITREGEVIGGLAWAKGDRGLLYSSDRGGDAGLWWVPSGGGTPQRVSEGLLDYRDLTHARDRGRLVFEAVRDRSSLKRLAAGASGTAPLEDIGLPEGDSQDLFPDVGPDGGIVFVSARTGQQQLWVAAPNEAPRQLSQLDGWRISDPRWSPSGRHIVFVGSRGGDTDLYLVGRDGGAPTRLTSDAAEDSSPAWSRDGRRLYFASRRGGASGIWFFDPFSKNRLPQRLLEGPGDIRLDPKRRWVYYLYPGRAGIWRRALTPDGEHATGAEVRITGDLAARDWMNWAVDDQAVYYAHRPAAIGTGRIRRLDLATRQVRDLTDAGPVHRGSTFAVAGDGSLLLVAHRLEIELVAIDFE